ncbi:MAG: HD domain-containing protein [Lachnospiraceae bacterium]|nr:HD domain-containing protein [Lachnospiraceae bacterium]
MNIEVPADAETILTTLHNAGFEASIVGGCVRDAILKRPPKDWDITTNALPEDVRRLFARTLPTGIRHGTVTVLIGKTGYEVTTYRIDGVYEDARHPKEVTFTASLAEDLRRRDFTINAMAYNGKDGLVDLFGGMEDLRAHRIRCVGNAAERFSEDALRMMRAYRFAAELGYEVSPETAGAAKTLSRNLEKISAERIRDELVRLVCSRHPDRMRDLYQAGLTAHFLPEFDRCMEMPQNNPHHIYSVGEHTIAAMGRIRPEPVLRLTMLLHDIAKPDTRTTDGQGIDHFYGHAEKSAETAGRILRRLKLDNRTIRQCVNLIRHHDMRMEGGITPANVRRAMHRAGRTDFPLLLEVIEADNGAKAPETGAQAEKAMKEVRRIYEAVLAAGDPVEIADLAVNGRDLMENGITEGREIGEVLERMLKHVLRNPAHNERSFLIDSVRRGQFLKTEQTD